MAVKLRLSRGGRKGAPHYNIVAADSRSPRDGRFIEKIGFYNPTAQPAQLNIDAEAAMKWLSNGAQPTNTVNALLRHAGVTIRYALHKQGKPAEQAEAIFTRWWNQKMASPKRKFVLVDKTGKPLPNQPEMAKAPKADTKQQKVRVKPVEEAPAAEEAATEEAAAE